MKKRRTDTELSNPDFNYYLYFRINPAVNDAKQIEEKVKAVLSRELDRRYNDLREDILQIMVNDAVFDEQSGTYIPKRGGRKAELERAKQLLIDSARRVAAHLNRSAIYKTEVESWGVHGGIVFVSFGELFNSVPELQRIEIIDFPIKKFLGIDDVLRRYSGFTNTPYTSLYDFLELRQSASVAEVDIAIAAKTQANYKKTDKTEVKLVNDLCGEASVTIGGKSDASRRAMYLSYLDVRDSVWIPIYTLSQKGVDTLTPKENEGYIATLERDLGLTNEQAREMLTHARSVFKLTVDESAAERLEKQRRRKKTKKAIVISSCSVAGAAALIFVYFLFALILPFINLKVTTKERAENEYVVTGVKDEKTTYLDIEDHLPDWLFRTHKKIVAIGDGAFDGNDYIKQVKLPACVTKIGSKSFADCSALASVSIAALVPPELNDDSFDGSSVTFYVPEKSYAAYLENAQWRRYADDIFPDYGNALTDACLVLDSNGGEAVKNVKRHARGTTAPDLPVPVKTGYLFDGWYTYGGERVESGSTVVSEDMKLVAHWRTERYAIEYELGGGDFLIDYPEYIDIETSVALADAARVGYYFDGWYSSADFSGKPIAELPVGTVGAQKLYARWRPYTYTLKFSSAGGTFADREVFTGQQISLPIPVPQSGTILASGYMFAGWSRTQGSTERVDWTAVPPLGDDGSVCTLYGIWERTPAWFTCEVIDGAMYVTGVNDYWHSYSGPLDKSQLYLPDKYGAEEVRGVAAGAFKDNTQVTAVVLPETVTSIGDNAFAGCTALNNVLGGALVTRVGRDAFTGVPWYTYGHDDDSWMLSVGQVAVKYDPLGGSYITPDFFPSWVTSLCSGLFADMFAGKAGSVEIADGVTYIGDGAFENSGFTHITLSRGVELGKSVFVGGAVKELTVRSAEISLSGQFASGAELDKITVELTDADKVLSVSGKGIVVKKLAATDGALTSATVADFESVDTLNLYNNRISSLSVGGIPTRILNLSNNALTSLKLDSVYATKIMLAGNAVTSLSCATENPYIKIIFMPSDGDKSDNKLTNLDFAANLPALRSLDVANNAVSNISGIAGLSLTELYLGGNPVLSNSSALSVIDNTECLANLVRLNLGGMGNASAVLSIVSKCTNLEWLQIYGIDASSSQITNTIKQSTHGKLKYIKISHNGFSAVPDGLKYISKVVIDYDDFDQG